MWQNNGFGNNGQFPNGFNSQENFPSSLGAPLGQLAGGPQYFPNQQNMMQYDDSNDDGFMSNDFQPEVGIYNEGAFLQTQFINANPQVCVVEPPNPFSQLVQPRRFMAVASLCRHSTSMIHFKRSLTFLCAPVLPITL